MAKSADTNCAGYALHRIGLIPTEVFVPLSAVESYLRRLKQVSDPRDGDLAVLRDTRNAIDHLGIVWIKHELGSHFLMIHERNGVNGPITDRWIDPLPRKSFFRK